MLASEFNTVTPALMSLSLAEVANPRYLTPVLEFVAKFAPACVAEALMSRIVAEDMQRTGRDRKTALSYLNGLIREMS